MAVAPDGHVTICGELRDDVVLGETTLTTPPGAVGTFLATYSPSGELLWARVLSSYDPLDEYDAVSIAYDPDGNLIVAGSFYHSVTLDETSVPVGGFPDAYAAKYAPDGTLTWSRIWATPDSQFAFDVAVRPSDAHLFVVGYFCGNLDFGCGQLDGSCGGNFDISLVELDPDGECVRATSFGANDGTVQAGVGVDVDVDGEIALSGQYAGSIRFPPAPAIVPPGELPPAQYASFVARLDPDWGGRFAQDMDYRGLIGATLESDGGLLYQGSVDPPLSSFDGTSGFGGTDLLFGKILANGDFNFQRAMGGPLDDGGFVLRDPGGDLHAYGFFSEEADLGGVLRTSAGGRDGFAAKVDAFGGAQPSGVATFGGIGDQEVNAAGFDASGREVLAGVFAGELQVDDQTLTSGAAFDIWIVAR